MIFAYETTDFSVHDCLTSEANKIVKVSFNFHAQQSSISYNIFSAIEVSKFSILPFSFTLFQFFVFSFESQNDQTYSQWTPSVSCSMRFNCRIIFVIFISNSSYALRNSLIYYDIYVIYCRLFNHGL